jgi:hypothetical protein
VDIFINLVVSIKVISMMHEFLAQAPVLSGFLHFSFLGPVQGERPNVPENSFFCLGSAVYLQSFICYRLLKHLISVYVMLTACVKHYVYRMFDTLLTYGADNSVMMCTSQYSAIVQ